MIVWNMFNNKIINIGKILQLKNDCVKQIDNFVETY